MGIATAIVDSDSAETPQERRSDQHHHQDNQHNPAL
jgi:hypothetical protein